MISYKYNEQLCSKCKYACYLDPSDGFSVGVGRVIYVGLKPVDHVFEVLKLLGDRVHLRLDDVRQRNLV